MIGFDIEHDGHCGIEREKRAVVLVGLHHVGVATESQIAGPECDTPADHTGGLATGGGECLGRHDRGGGLAMCTGDADQRTATHGIGQCFGAPHQRDPSRAGRDHLGMRRSNRRRVDDGARAGHECGIVRRNGDAIAHQIGRARRIGIRTLNAHTPAHEQFRQRAHTGTGNADEVHGT